MPWMLLFLSFKHIPIIFRHMDIFLCTVYDRWKCIWFNSNMFPIHAHAMPLIVAPRWFHIFMQNEIIWMASITYTRFAQSTNLPILLSNKPRLLLVKIFKCWLIPWQIYLYCWVLILNSGNEGWRLKRLRLKLLFTMQNVKLSHVRLKIRQKISVDLIKWYHVKEISRLSFKVICVAITSPNPAYIKTLYQP